MEREKERERERERKVELKPASPWDLSSESVNITSLVPPGMLFSASLAASKDSLSHTNGLK